MRDFFRALRAAWLAGHAAYHRQRDLQKRRARLPDFFA
jgi:hypothetical protein